MPLQPAAVGSVLQFGARTDGTNGMSTIIEDPGIPLVGKSGAFRMYTREKQTTTKTQYGNVGERLARRKVLYHTRKVICDCALFFALLGICLMIVDSELYLTRVYNKQDTASLLIKVGITISTITLLGFVMWYHVLDIKLFMSDNLLTDWRLAMSTKRILKIALELIIYSIHPLPGQNDFTVTKYDVQSGTMYRVTFSVDVLCSVPMFLRLFLVCRVMMLHSKLYTDASSQSIGALNRIRFNFKFIFKSLMTLYPEYVLTVVIATVLLIATWLLRACEMYHDDYHTDFLNSMWLITITFLSVGYGDIVPSSYCGRGIAVMTGMFGAGCTALIVAILARKLEFSREEKYVHNFVMDVELDKRYRVSAANIVKAGWLVYKNRKLGKHMKARKYQRKLLKAIHRLREIKQEQRRIQDSGITLVELFKNQNSVYNMLNRFQSTHTDMDSKLVRVEDRLSDIDKRLYKLYSLLSRHGVATE